MENLDYSPQNADLCEVLDRSLLFTFWALTTESTDAGWAGTSISAWLLDAMINLWLAQLSGVAYKTAHNVQKIQQKLGFITKLLGITRSFKQYR